MTATNRTLVMGVGNPLMGDEGVGPRIVEFLLSHFEIPEGLQIVDAGTMGFTILNLFGEADRVLVVDAVDGTEHPPGTVLLLTPEDMAPNQVLHSLHDTRLTDVLDAARLVNIEPEVTCIGVQVEQIVQWELELSPVVEAAVPAACEAVVEHLRSWGIELAAQDQTLAPEGAHVISALRTKEPMPERSSEGA